MINSRHAVSAALVGTLGFSSIGLAATIDEVKLNPKLIAPGCSPIDGEHPVSIQAGTHFATVESYGLFKPPVRKAYQSFDCGGVKSSVYYFEYATRGDLERAKGFTEGLMWGEGGPSAEHPELVVAIDNVLVVISSRNPAFFKDRLVLRPTATAAAGLARTFDVPGHGALELEVPKSWKSKMVSEPSQPYSTITLESPNDSGFVVMITPLWSPKGDEAFNRPEAVRRLVDKDRNGMAPQAVEKEIVLQSFDGAEAHGYYFVMTDKAPNPGSWEYAYRAGAGVGDLLLSVTILSHKKESAAVQDALTMLRKARQLRVH